MKKLLLAMLVLLNVSCAFWAKTPEAEVNLTYWQQEVIFIEGYGNLNGLVKLQYDVVNTGEVDIDFYSIMLGVTAVSVASDTNEYTFETVGAYLDEGSTEALSTFMDVGSDEAIKARIINIDVERY